MFAWRLAGQRWHRYGSLPMATMDHRGLLANAGTFFIIGGMIDGEHPADDEPVLSSLVHEFTLQ